jgi:phospholipid/cholesterol/gamma-HCH transport system substrate-binding protein
MKFSKVEFLVGAFMLAGIGAILALALQVAGLSFKPEGETYTLRAHFDNIGGLKVRSPVKVGGVVVGRVSDITLDAKSQVPIVSLQMQKSAGEFSETSTLSILTSGLLGEQYIGLARFSDEEMGTSMLKDGDMIEDTKSAIVLEDLIGKFLYSQSSGHQIRQQVRSNHVQEDRPDAGPDDQHAVFLTAQATDATDPYALVDQAAKQTFARLKADQAQVKSNRITCG